MWELILMVVLREGEVMMVEKNLWAKKKLNVVMRKKTEKRM